MKDRTLIAISLLGSVALGLFLDRRCVANLFHPPIKATSDDAPAPETAGRSDWSPSSASGAVDAEVASSTPSSGPTQTYNASVREQEWSVAGGDSLAGAALEWATDGELDVSITPTPEGLYARTTALWESPDFLELTVDEAHALLPVDDSMPAKMPGTLLGALGCGLPTLEDCGRGLRDPEAAALLQETLAAELTLYALHGAPRGPARVDAIETALRAFNVTEARLYARLDEVSGYREWSLLARLFREMSR